MQQVALWTVADGKPARLRPGNVGLEKDLEDLIEQDPSLLRDDLFIIHRQMRVPAGRLDLLALDPLGRFVVIEIKPDAVSSSTVSQALYYASCISEMPLEDIASNVDSYLASRGVDTTLRSLLEQRQVSEAESAPREVQIMVVGTGAATDFERFAQYLSKTYEMPIEAVLFDVFDVPGGAKILLRELPVVETAPPASTSARPKWTLDELCAAADANGIGPQFRAIRAAAERNGLAWKLFPYCVMYTWPRNRNNMLFTVWTHPKRNGVFIWTALEIFARYYPITKEEAAQFIGPGGGCHMSPSDVDTFIAGLDRLFVHINGVNRVSQVTC
ncbi:MAG: endonuclease NucS domain-containing protein [Chloroflexia bacterium]